MTTPLVTTYAGRFASPEFIERAKAQRLTFEVYHEGRLVVPDSGTLLLRDASNVAVVNEAAVSIVNGAAVYDLPATAVPASYAPSRRWLADWTLTVSDGQVHTFRRSVHLCLRRLYPVITPADLTRRHHDLQSIVSRAKSTLQPYIDSAYDVVIFRLIEDGRYPQQIMTPESLWLVELLYALHLAFTDAMLNAPGDGKYGGLAEKYEKDFEAAWLRLRFTIDHDESNTPPSSTEEGESESPVVFLGGSPSTRQHR